MEVLLVSIGKIFTKCIINDCEPQRQPDKISNPPYSVKGFLETLTSEERAEFEMFKAIDNKSIITNNSIEAFFVERAKQLLAPGGVAAIILPSSLLSNSGAVYTKAREIILQYFDIVAIAEFGSGTFGKTGTNTVTLFLRRKEEDPALAVHYRNRVNAWFSCDFEKDGVFADVDLLTAYCKHIGYTVDDYKTLLNSAPSENLLSSDAFKAYRTAFDSLTETKNRIKQKTFKALGTDAQKAELLKRFTEYAREIEKDKLYYYMLAYSNPQEVVVVKSPSGTSESKRFLGYEWSSRKGAEGIKYIGVATSDDRDDETLSRLKGIKSIQTPLFNPADLADVDKINSVIRANFNGELIGDGQCEFVKRYRLVDMIDFHGVKFEKQISLIAAKTLEVVSKYPTESLASLAETNPSKSEISKVPDDTIVSFVEMSSISNQGFIENKVDRPLHELRSGSYTYFKDEDIIIAKITPCYENGKCALATGLTNGLGMGSSEFHVIRCGERINNRYMFAYLNRDIIREVGESHMTGASGHRRVPDDYYKQLQIPLPPPDIQREIVAACEEVDTTYNRTRMSIEEYRKKIEELFNEMGASATLGEYSLSDSRIFSLSIGKRILDTQLVPNGEVPVYSANVFEPFGYIDERLITDFRVPSVLWGIDGDWQVNYIPAEREFYPTDHCGVLRVLTDDIHPRCLAWALGNVGKERGFTRTLRASIDRVKRLKIQLPSIDKQREVAEKVFELESLIAAAKSMLTELDTKRKSVLDEYLR